MGFIFGDNAAPSYDALKRRRDIVEMLQQRALQPVHDIGSGIAGLGTALLARYADSKLVPQEDAARQSAVQQMAKMQGVAPEMMSQAASIEDNPYAPKGASSIVNALLKKSAGSNLSQGMNASPDPNAVMSIGAGPQASMPGNDRSAMLIPQQRQPRWSDPDAPEPWIPEEPNAADEIAGVNPLQRMSGSGKPLQTASAATGPRYAANDTVKNDASDNMKLTEQQSKDLGYWNRMDGVKGDLEKYQGALTSRKDQALDSVPFFGNSMISEDYQRGRRAAGEWITALLRKDTGATVTPEEWKIYGPIWIPQPGDYPSTLADKAAARERAAQGLKEGLGTAEILANELALERQKNAPAAPPAAAPAGDWRTQDPSTWTDEQLQEFTK